MNWGVSELREREKERIYELRVEDYDKDVDGYIVMPRGIYINTGKFPDRCRFPSSCEFRGHLEFGIDNIFNVPMELSDDSSYCGLYRYSVKRALTVQIIGGDKITFYFTNEGNTIADNIKYRMIDGEIRATYMTIPPYIMEDVTNCFRKEMECIS